MKIGFICCDKAIMGERVSLARLSRHITPNLVQREIRNSTQFPFAFCVVQEPTPGYGAAHSDAVFPLQSITLVSPKAYPETSLT